MRDIAHFLRPATSQQLRNILDDPEASDNDRFVALDLLKNASIAAGGVLPMCQDTGTAIVKGKKGQFVFTGGGDEAAIAARRVQHLPHVATCATARWRRSTMYEEVNTGNNLPAEIKIAAVDGDAYKFLFMAKGGGSANKSYLFQETKALLNEATLLPWLFEKMQTLGTAACPPYHLAVVIGGTSAEFAVETAKLASHALPRQPAHRRARRPATASATSSSSSKVLRARPADRHRRPVRRQVLLPRRAHHPPPPPRRELPGGDGRVVLGRPPGAGQDHRATACSSSSSRRDPARFLPDVDRRRPRRHATVVHIDLNRPMDEIRAELSQLPGARPG